MCFFIIEATFLFLNAFKIGINLIMSSQNSFSTRLGGLLTRLGLNMKAKLILLFVVIKVLPLVLLALVAWYQAVTLGDEMTRRTRDIADKAIYALTSQGEIAIDDAVEALDKRGTEEIERLTTDIASQIARFLYGRDDDIRLVSSFGTNKKFYEDFIKNRTLKVIKKGEWVLSDDQKSWVPKHQAVSKPKIESSNKENDVSYHYRAKDSFNYVDNPLYHEITFVDLDGNETIKVTNGDLLSPELKNVSDKKNTFIKAEDYFQHLKDLEPGEIYVSDVIGAYVGTPFIGTFTPEMAKKKGVPFEPEKAAYAGPENPVGKKFRGIIRWATPVVENDEIIGYVTLALDHENLASFVEHVVPNDKRYSELSDPIEGNYAFIWDHKGRNIVHPRHHSIAAHDPETGELQAPWLPDNIYQAWQASGKSYETYIKDVPTIPWLDDDIFYEWQESGLEYEEFVKTNPDYVFQSKKIKPSLDMLKQGNVGLDCKYLHFAPQCTGWYEVTRSGGSGSFLILWSGLWKLTTAAAIPYYTGQFGENERGFAIVTITAGVDDFHKATIKTQQDILGLVEKTQAELTEASDATFATITKNLLETAISLSSSTILMTVLVVIIAIWMASSITQQITHMIDGISKFMRGERLFRFNAQIKDEMGLLADSFDDLADNIVNSVNGPLIITDLDRKIIYLNEPCAEIIGKPQEELIGQSYDDVSVFYPPEKYSPITAFLEGREHEPMYNMADNRFYRAPTSFFTDRDDNNVGFLITPIDVTELILEQERIEYQRTLLNTVISSSPDLIWYQDEKDTYLSVNPRFAALVGCAPSEIQGKNRDEILPEEIAKVMKENDAKAISKEKAIHSEEHFVFADGHEETLDAVHTPLFNADGNFIGLLGVARDVTKRVTMENKLLETQKDLVKAVEDATKASNSKSEFLARMSHEIRTPMNAIIGMTNITKRKINKNETSKETLMPHVQQIESSSMHLLGLLNDILDISKIEAGKIELSNEAFNINDLVEEVATIIRPRCLSKNINFIVKHDGFECSNFSTDVLRLKQILINLLGNAAKFTSELGNITFEVKQLERKDGKSKIKFSVKDDGIGIKADKIATLFVPFEQGGSHITRNYGGTGLGLSISRNIAVLLGSDIKVASEEGKGSEFYFSLWLTENDVAISQTEEQSDASIVEGQRILLVDDVDINRIIAIELLSPFKLEIEEACDGSEALEKFKNSPEGFYDMIFMDIQMPTMNGYETSKAIRQLERSDSSVPIVAMTANAFKDDIDMAFLSGMNGHIAKPIEMSKVTDALKKFLKTE